MKIDIKKENINYFNALASETRLKILEYLLKKPYTIKELSILLDLSMTIVSKHVRILEETNFIEILNEKAVKGIQKKCKIILRDYTLGFKRESIGYKRVTEQEISIGTYSNYEISPTCGLATKEKILGECDDIRYFSHLEKEKAGILWFGSGWIEYKLPSYLFEPENLEKIEITLEICSECPGVNLNFLSDIYFYINGKELGQWTSPGDFGDRKGRLSPKWWFLTEYGILKKITISKRGIFIDNKKVSDMTIKKLNISKNEDSIFRISAPRKTKNSGGLTLFGKDFGDYNQGIILKIYHNK